MGYHSLVNEFGLTQAKVAERLVKVALTLPTPCVLLSWMKN